MNDRLHRHRTEEMRVRGKFLDLEYGNVNANVESESR